MPHNRIEPPANPGKVIFELVAWRYSDEQQVMLSGEAEIVIETFGSERNPAEAGTNLYAIRIDILSAFDPGGLDCYWQVMANTTLRQAVEAAALEHYLFPPQVHVGLPRQVVEW